MQRLLGEHSVPAHRPAACKNLFALSDTISGVGRAQGQITEDLLIHMSMFFLPFDTRQGDRMKDQKM